LAQPIDDIASIEADLHSFSLLRPEPEDDEAAGFSAPYLLATTLIYGTVGLDRITDEAVRDPKLQALMKQVKHVPSAKKDVDRVAIRYHNGEEQATEVSSRTRRLADKESIERKFDQCAASTLKPAAIEDLRGLLLGIDGLDKIDRLMSLAGGR
jgi:2-methylcitrate dehydratase PrpD